MLYLMCMWHGSRRIRADDFQFFFSCFSFFLVFFVLVFFSGRMVLSLGRFCGNRMLGKFIESTRGSCSSLPPPTEDVGGWVVRPAMHLLGRFLV